MKTCATLLEDLARRRAAPTSAEQGHRRLTAWSSDIIGSSVTPGWMSEPARPDLRGRHDLSWTS